LTFSLSWLETDDDDQWRNQGFKHSSCKKTRTWLSEEPNFGFLIVKGCELAFEACFFFVEIVHEHDISSTVQVGLPWIWFLVDHLQSARSLRLRRRWCSCAWA
jgi:hypothetical protein